MLLYGTANFTTAVPTANSSSSNGRVCRTFQVSDAATCELTMCHPRASCSHVRLLMWTNLTVANLWSHSENNMKQRVTMLLMVTTEDSGSFHFFQVNNHKEHILKKIS